MKRAFHLATAAILLFALGVAWPANVRGQRGAGTPDRGNALGGGQRGGGQGGGQGGRAGGFFRGRGELPAGTSAIRGRVLSSDTGSPVRRAQVRATGAGVPGGRLASTDVEGRFEFRDLPAGQWSLTASKPGFVTQRFGQRRPFESVPPIQLAEGQRLDNANFALAKGGAINGRVLDDLGDPVANVRVQVHRTQMVDGRRRLTSVGTGDETDDTGAFRLYGLAPGEYFVSATLRANPFEANNDRSGYAPTYYPGTGNAAEAQRITLGSGEETSIGFSLLPVRTVRVSGTVVSASGTAATNGIVVLSSAADSDDAGVITATGGQILNDGTFTIVNVAPGSYVMNVRSGFGPRTNTEMEIGTLPITVGDSDIAGVTIAMTRGASIAGTVVAEGGSAITLANLRITARPLHSGAGLQARNASVTTAGAFQLSALSGLVAIRVDNLPQQWALKSITVGNADATDAPLDLKGTEQVANARIVITDRVTEVNGSATLRDQAGRDFTVVVFADDQNRWTFPTRYVRTTRANQQGQFTIRGLPPASYLAVAVSSLEDGESQDPEFLDRMRESATTFSLREGETRTLSLRLLER